MLGRPSNPEIAALAIVLVLAAAPFAPFRPEGPRVPTAPLAVQSSVPYLGGWVNVTPSLSPPAVGGGIMAFSSRADEFVLFGGSDGDPTNSTWVLDLHGTMWTQLHPAVSPPARVDGMLAYDAVADAFVLFGGWYESPAGAYLRWDDTWAFYLSNDTWVPRHPAVSPSPRSDAGFAYDPRADAAFLVGGFSGTAYLGDEWAYSFSNDTWWPRSAAVTPSPRADGRMVYDPGTDAFYLYGGNDYSGPNFTYHHLGDTWRYSWTPQAWTQLFPAVTPGALDYAVLAADTHSGVLLMMGGYGDSVVLGNTWVFNTTTIQWAPLTTLASPSPRMAAVGGYDPVADQFLVFSGGDKVSAKDDTWILTYPPVLLASAVASTSDAVTGSLVEFSGRMIGGTGFLRAANWSFGDGSTARGTNVSHAFGTPGVYTVTFAVTDARGLSAAAQVQVRVGLLGPYGGELVIAGTAALLVVGVAVVLWRRRRRPPRAETRGNADGPDDGGTPDPGPRKAG